jgi:uncharacterized membrane protein
MGPNDPFRAASSFEPDIEPRPSLDNPSRDGEHLGRTATAIGAGVGLAFGLLALQLGFWTAIAIAALAAVGACIGRLVGSPRARARTRRVIGAKLNVRQQT